MACSQMTPSILHRYILKELFQFFLISLIAFTFIMVVTQISILADLTINKGVAPSAIGLLIFYTLPYSFVFTLPISTLLAVLLTFLRLSHDNEMTAIKASGISLYQILPPVFVLSVFAYLCASYMAIYATPKGTRAFNELVYSVARERAYIGIKPRYFNDEFKDIVLYANEVDVSGKYLEDIFISDKRDPRLSHTIVAKKGVILSDPDRKRLALKLTDGSIHYDSQEMTSSDTIWFSTYELSLDLRQFERKQKKGGIGRGEMSVSQLIAELRSSKSKDVRYNLYLMELHRKFAIPLSCIILGMIAVPLGIQTRISGSSGGVSLGLGVFLLYYILVATGRSFGESGVYPPALGMWIPNIVIGALTIFMLQKAASEKPIGLLSLFNRLSDQIRNLGHSRKTGRSD
ncbi:MAG: LPS export ABC transporter permease LptF [Desulfobacterales bacterium S5133MH16]|nr:MAG: LPS export ABC transporter permease LptF [Desulfobacterales bacterium S5133MH16]